MSTVTTLGSHLQFSTEKITMYTKKCESMAHWWGKMTEIVSSRPDGRYTRQRLFNNFLKDTQRSKGKCVEEVKEVIYEQNGNICEKIENLKRVTSSRWGSSKPYSHSSIEIQT